MLIRDAANTDALDSLSELQRRVRVLSGRAASEKRKWGSTLCFQVTADSLEVHSPSSSAFP